MKRKQPLIKGSDVFESTAEYRLLQLVLKWIGGHEGKEQVSIFEFLNETTRHVFRTFEEGERRMQSDYRLTLSVDGPPIHIEYLDVDGGNAQPGRRQASILGGSGLHAPDRSVKRSLKKSRPRSSFSVWSSVGTGRQRRAIPFSDIP